MGGLALRLGWAKGPSDEAIPCYKENIVNYLRKFLLGKIYNRENAVFPSWGSFHLGNCHLGSCRLGKTFGNVPNICKKP